MSNQNLADMESAQSIKRIGFDEAEVVANFPGGYLLVVRGTAPCVNMEVRLSPLIYIECPDYWGIEVIGLLPGGICLTAVKPYVATIALQGVTGSQGIEVLGANRSERFDVPDGCKPGLAFT